MIKEKIIRKPDGMRVKIMVVYDISVNRQSTPWKWAIEICEKRKRTWTCPFDADDYRKLSRKDKIKFRRKKVFQYVKKEDILVAMTELWEEMKPKLEDV